MLSAEPQPRLLGSLRVGDGQTYGGEVLLVGDRALVLVPGYRTAPEPATGSTSGTASDTTADRSMIFRPGTPTTRVLLLDVSGDQPRLLETATYDAQYVSARLHDGTVRLVTTTRPQPPVVYPRGPSPAEERLALTENQLRAADITLRDVVPQVRRIAADGTVQQEGSAVDCRRTYHAQSPQGVSTLMVTTMRPADGLAATDSTAVTTDGDLVYASSDRLYVATSRWGTVGPFMPMTRASSSSISSGVVATDEVSTELHGFDISSGTETRYLGSGSVPGYVLGRWALSSHEGALRVATTRQPPWDSERAGNTSSMVVKLAERDGRLVETGRVEGLGRTEQIRAVRYFGDVAAVVTFRQTDPLYLLDLSGTPRVLGELKVPGFSTYLHPLGDGKLLGLGQDADENGQVTGVQVSVFDIADLSKPSLVDRLRLGHGWTPALDDSRAFTYDPDRRTATFAFTSYDPTGQDGQTASAALGIAVDASGHLREVGRMPLAVDTWSARVLVDDERVYAVGDTRRGRRRRSDVDADRLAGLRPQRLSARALYGRAALAAARSSAAKTSRVSVARYASVMFTPALPSLLLTSPRMPGRSCTATTSTSCSEAIRTPAAASVEKAAGASSIRTCTSAFPPPLATAQKPWMFTPAAPRRPVILASSPGWSSR